MVSNAVSFALLNSVNQKYKKYVQGIQQIFMEHLPYALQQMLQWTKQVPCSQGGVGREEGLGAEAEYEWMKCMRK